MNRQMVRIGYVSIRTYSFRRSVDLLNYPSRWIGASLDRLRRFETTNHSIDGLDGLVGLEFRVRELLRILYYPVNQLLRILSSDAPIQTQASSNYFVMLGFGTYSKKAIFHSCRIAWQTIALQTCFVC